jgi:hypothetical protein
VAEAEAEVEVEVEEAALRALPPAQVHFPLLADRLPQVRGCRAAFPEPARTGPRWS